MEILRPGKYSQELTQQIYWFPASKRELALTTSNQKELNIRNPVLCAFLLVVCNPFLHIFACTINLQYHGPYRSLWLLCVVGWGLLFSLAPFPSLCLLCDVGWGLLFNPAASVVLVQWSLFVGFSSCFIFCQNKNVDYFWVSSLSCFYCSYVFLFYNLCENQCRHHYSLLDGRYFIFLNGRCLFRSWPPS